MKSRTVSVLLFTWIVGFVGYFGGDVTPHDMTLRALAIGIYGMPIVLAATWMSLHHRHPFDGWVAFVLGAYGLVCLLSSDRTASLETFGLVSVYAGVFAIGLRIHSLPLRGLIAVAIALAVTMWSVILGIQWVSDAGDWLVAGGGWPPPPARSPILWLSTDATGALVLVAAPFFFWIQHRGVKHLIGGLTLLGAMVILVMSGGRAEILGLAAAVIIWTALSPLRRKVRWRAPQAVFTGLALVTLAGIVVAIALRTDPTLSGRTYIWSNVIGLIGIDPMTGSGPGTLSWARLEHAAPFVDRIPVYHAHNLLLQTMADGGLILLMAFLATVIAFLRYLVGGIARLETGARVAAGSLVGFAVILQLDELTQLPALAAMALLQAGILLGEAVPSSVKTNMGIPLLSAALILSVVISSPSVATVQVARTEAQGGRAIAAVGDWDRALDEFSRAVETWPTNAIYRMSVGLALTHLGRNDEARGAYLVAAELVPGDPRPYGALASLAASRGERIDLLMTAAQRANGDAQYSYRLASDLWDSGDHERALTAYARAGALNPQLLAMLPSRGPTPTKVAEAMLDLARDSLAGMRLNAERVAGEAHAILRVNDADDPSATQAVAHARLGNFEAGLNAANRAIEDRDGVDAYRAAAAIARMVCDEVLGRRYERLLALLNPNYGRFYVTGHVTGARDNVYRELGMGDYQPMPPLLEIPHPTDWPGPLLALPTCDKQTMGS